MVYDCMLLLIALFALQGPASQPFVVGVWGPKEELPELVHEASSELGEPVTGIGWEELCFGKVLARLVSPGLNDGVS